MPILPWNTDAPIYHWPYATVGLISANVLSFVGMWFLDRETLIGLTLAFGDGLHPVQWLTACFLHAGFWHLAGNMFFLWSFGLVVEGKVGWRRFLAMYLALGIASNLALQIAGLGREGGHALGASAAIFGLMGVAVAWAPENELEFIAIISLFGAMVRTHAFSARIRTVALFYLGLNLLTSAMSGFGISGALAHLVGAAFGFPLGWWMLNTGRVDCEGWDLFTLIEKRREDRRSFEQVQRRGALKDDAPPSPGDIPAAVPTVVVTPQSGQKALGRLRELLNEHKGAAALALYEKVSHLDKRWKLPEPELVKLIDLLHAENRLVESVPFLEDYLTCFREHEINLRLRLARILIEQQQRPNYALRVLTLLPSEPLPDAMERLRTRLKEQAQKLIDEGVLELEGQAWQ